MAQPTSPSEHSSSSSSTHIQASLASTAANVDRPSDGLSVRPLMMFTLGARCDALKHEVSARSRMENAFLRISSVTHPHLSRPVRLLQLQSDRTLLVELRGRPSLAQKLHKCCKLQRQFKEAPIRAHLAHLASALAHLHHHEVFLAHLSPSSVAFRDNDAILCDWAYFHLIRTVPCCLPAGWGPPYMAPEVFAASQNTHLQLDWAKADLWSLGIVLLEYMLGAACPWRTASPERHDAKTAPPPAWPPMSPQKLYLRLRSLLQALETTDTTATTPSGSSVPDACQVFGKYSSDLRQAVLALCTWSPRHRSRPKSMDGTAHAAALLYKPRLHLHCLEEVQAIDHEQQQVSGLEGSLCHMADSMLRDQRETKELTRFLERFLWPSDMAPSAFYIPTALAHAGEDVKMGYPREIMMAHPLTTPLIGSTEMEEMAAQLSCRPFESGPSSHRSPEKVASPTLSGIHGDFLRTARAQAEVGFPQRCPYLSLLREGDLDVAFQHQQVQMFRDLLLRSPVPRVEILQRAQRHIPAVLRGEIWASLLGVEPILEAERLYATIDLTQPIDSDRQIAVDVPRCHQYSPKLASPLGRQRLACVLKAWVVHHCHCVYWQGLDSLCAPVLALLFPSEALAFCTLKAIVAQHVPHFFASNHSAVMEERLARYTKVLAYHDPELSTHLQQLDLRPELYAIPWFLTLFAHVLPIPKVHLLWDALFTGTKGLALAIAASIVIAKREALLRGDFSQGIMEVCALHSLDVSALVTSAQTLAARTPGSVLEPPFHFAADGVVLAAHASLSLAQYCAIPSAVLTPADLHRMLQLPYDVQPSLHINSRTAAVPVPEAAPVLVLDIRPPSQFAIHHIPNSLHIPFNPVGRREDYEQGLLPPVQAAQCGRPLVVVAVEAEDLAVVAGMLVRRHLRHVSACVNPYPYFRDLGLLYHSR
eukprot:GGOE01018032.1.p1 GENE.GGOE01018032.1~~GGOE01018032.1.p1  ORF type:complete len:938 (+),score=210.33 GGOE01018032.1:23-2815(+)